jgi:uncharacterized protein YjbI with pentapeptide repeats
MCEILIHDGGTAQARETNHWENYKPGLLLVKAHSRPSTWAKLRFSVPLHLQKHLQDTHELLQEICDFCLEVIAMLPLALRGVPKQLGAFLNAIVSWLKQGFIGMFLLIFGILIGILGYLDKLDFLPRKLTENFYANAVSELVGIAITVLVIDALNGRRERRQLKEQLIRDMSGIVHDFSLRAVSEMRATGWLYDGSLRGLHLRGADLRKAQLGGANLENAYLNNANLEEADFNSTGTFESDLPLFALWKYRARSCTTNLRGCDLTRTNLRRAKLRGVDLREAILINADLQEADLSRGRAREQEGTMLTVTIKEHPLASNLEGAILHRAKLMKANLQGANLQRAELREADLQGANLRNADLRGAVLAGAKPIDFRFTRSWRGRLELSDVEVDSRIQVQANLRGAVYNYKTVWPAGFHPESFGAILVKDRHTDLDWLFPM